MRMNLHIYSPLRSLSSYNSLFSRCFFGLTLWARVYFFTKGFEWFCREDRFNGEIEELADAKGQLQAGIILAALQVSHRLIINTHRVSQAQTTQTTLSTQNRQAIVNDKLRHLSLH